MCKLKTIEYEMTIKFKIKGDFEGIDDIKSGREYATDLCNMVADECAVTDKVVEYDILESELNIN